MSSFNFFVLLLVGYLAYYIVMILLEIGKQKNATSPAIAGRVEYALQGEKHEPKIMGSVNSPGPAYPASSPISEVKNENKVEEGKNILCDLKLELLHEHSGMDVTEENINHHLLSAA